MPSYAKPAARVSAGSSMFRPSRMSGRAIASRTAFDARPRSPAHSGPITAASAPSTAPRTEKVRAEVLVEPDSLCNLDDVRADRLAHVRDLVDERDPGHEKCIRGELDHLGRRDVRPQ